MRLIAHRGLWLEPQEKNTAQAFARSLGGGYGIETDVRDLGGKLVISHDPPQGTEMTLDAFLDLVRREARRPAHTMLALNIKADGLALALCRRMNQEPFDWFVFDMSVPDMVQHAKVGNPIYARVSEVEQLPQHPSLQHAIRGVWLDGFWSTWYSCSTIEALLVRGLGVCAVSPELHGRSRAEALAFWQAIKPLAAHPQLALCTDWPQQAAEALEIGCQLATV